ncbi:MAG: hypothetical protein ACK5QH_15790 [Rubrivivax sp.]
MAENESFFRKVVRFVANPATDWTELNSRQEDSRELEIEKSELKAMIERKRRNDFVRKREFDMLRRVRREGLSPEQVAALGGSSRLDDSEARLPDSQIAKPDLGVKAKIDEIEQQMVGDGLASGNPRRPGSFGPTHPGAPGPALNPVAHSAAVASAQAAFPPPAPGPLSVPGSLAPRPAPPRSPPVPMQLSMDDELPALPPLPDIELPPAAPPAVAQMGAGLPPLAPLQTMPSASGAFNDPGAGFGSPFAVEVSEVVHDPELDEAVIAFANADFNQCENALQSLTGPQGARSQHAETWLVLFDLYRAIGQQQRFESLALDYAQQFGWSAPQWYSLPRLVADAVAEEKPTASASARGPNAGEVGWVSPEVLDIDAVARLRSQTLQMPLPWVFDWNALRMVEAEAAMQLSMLFRLWAGQALEMRWLSGDRFFSVLAEAAPTGVRDADPAFWLTRLDGLRLANRADQFDETAIDYCVTYEVSPPSWEPARCQVRISGSGHSTRTPPMSVISDVTSSFLESTLTDDPAGPGQVEQSNVELSGQLVGDIGATLQAINQQLGLAPVVSVSCARLIRVDFIAAGDLLNWVLAKRSENRAVQFVDAHRLVALFFGAMGINEHARVQVRKV